MLPAMWEGSAMRGGLAGLLGCGLAPWGAGPALAHGPGSLPLPAIGPDSGLGPRFHSGPGPSAGSSTHGGGPASQGAVPAGAMPLTAAEAAFIGLRKNRASRSQYLQRIADRLAFRVAERPFVPRLDVQAGAARARTGNSSDSRSSVGPVVRWDTPTSARFQSAFLGSQDQPRGHQRAANSQLSFTVIPPLLGQNGAEA